MDPIKGTIIGFIPKRLVMPGFPKLCDFPYNILFLSYPDTRYCAVYVPRVETYKETDGLSLMTYVNEGDPQARVIILRDHVNGRWHGEKFFRDELVGQADGSEWDSFFFHLTILGCDRRERVTGSGDAVSVKRQSN